MPSEELSQAALKVCGALAIFGAAGLIGTVAGAAFATAVGGAVAVPLFEHVAHAGGDLLKAMGDSMVEDAISDRREAQSSQTNHHVIIAIVEALEQAVNDVHSMAKRNKLTEPEQEALRVASKNLYRLRRDQQRLAQFGNSLNLALEERVGNDPTAVGRMLVQACLVEDEAIELSTFLDIPIQDALNLRGHVTDAVSAQRLVSLVREDFSKNLGPRMTQILAHNALIRDKFDTISKGIQMQANRDHAEVLRSIQGELALQKSFFAKNEVAQAEFRELLLNMFGAILDGQKIIIGQLDQLQSSVSEILTNVAYLRNENEELKEMVRELIGLVRAQGVR